MAIMERYILVNKTNTPQIFALEWAGGAGIDLGTRNRQWKNCLLYWAGCCGDSTYCLINEINKWGECPHQARMEDDISCYSTPPPNLGVFQMCEMRRRCNLNLKVIVLLLLLCLKMDKPYFNQWIHLPLKLWLSLVILPLYLLLRGFDWLSTMNEHGNACMLIGWWVWLFIWWDAVHCMLLYHRLLLIGETMVGLCWMKGCLKNFKHNMCHGEMCTVCVIIVHRFENS